jgi:putative transposase
VRGDALAKLSTALAQTHHVVAVETLHAEGMRRRKPDAGRAGRATNRALADASLAELRRQLAYKTAWYGSTLVEAPSGSLPARGARSTGR